MLRQSNRKPRTHELVTCVHTMLILDLDFVTNIPTVSIKTCSFPGKYEVRSEVLTLTGLTQCHTQHSRSQKEWSWV